MKILFVAPRFHTNQVQIIKILLEKKHEVFFHVACIGATEDHSLVKPICYKQSWLSRLIEKKFDKGQSNKRFYFPDISAYWKAMKQLRPQIVVIRDPYKLFSQLAAFFALLIKARIIFYTQEDLLRSRSRKALLKQKLTINFFRAAWITPIKSSNSREEKGWHRYIYHVPLPVNICPEDACRKDIPNEGPKILMIGKYHQERKKHMLFLQALDNLKNRYLFSATIAGECANEEQLTRFMKIKAAAQDFELDDRVELKQNVPFNQMSTLYASHNIFVLPAVNEPYSISVNEAMGYGLPVICTDTCGTKINIYNGDNGFVIKSDSLEELTTSLESLLSNYRKLNQMRIKTLQYAREYLSGDAFYLKFARVTRERFSIIIN
ncbi:MULTISPECIES: glycosyltransferase family 4 protein [Niastella]|uniref:Glycosyltransferase family 4 protein n=1 Tax=Niastella soli TaxID=2821487 RepID=A0ABS3YRP1_9BACT|nr:glycosyltransferase family 4 protein [Niastella soli]MBO9200514.1 glycosyltransferase family 4 protein [Niastella soli]